MALPNFLKTFRSTIENLRSEVVAVERRLELARRRREELDVLPPTKTEVIAILCAWVNSEAAKYPATLRSNLDKIFRDRNPVSGEPNYGAGVIQPDILLVADAGKIATPAHMQSSLTFFLRDALLDGIKRAVLEMPDWKAGPPRAERIAEIARLDAEIADLETQLGEMVAQAAESGVSIGSSVMLPKRREPKVLGRWSDGDSK